MGWMAPAPTDGTWVPRCGRCRRSSHAAAGAIPLEITTVVVTGLADQIGAVQIPLTRLEKALLAWHRDSDLSRRLATIPGLGIVSATALAASVSEPERFRNGRRFPPRWAGHRCRTPAAARSAWAGSRAWATATCAACS